jgi:Uncharacterized protein conserved in bacteria (DUF2188)
MAQNNRHVAPTKDGQWAVRDEGSERASDLFGTQKKAQDRAREILGKSGGGELITHGLDGKILASETIAPR